MDTNAIAYDMARGISCEDIGTSLGHSGDDVRAAMMTPEGIHSLTSAVITRRKKKSCQSKIVAEVEHQNSPKTTTDNLTARRKEFDNMCWEHTKDEFQSKFDECPPITDDENTALLDILAPFSENADSPDAAEEAAYRAIGNGMDILYRVLQLVGLTRNKILQDIKSHVKANGIPIQKSSLKSVIGTDTGKRIATKYLSHWLERVFKKFPINTASLSSLNTVTWPSYIRQARAKMSGHNAEHALARLFKNCDLPFGPEKKASEPMSGDIKVNGVSYDLISPSKKNPLVLIKCSAHTANLGQYGDKIIHEINMATESISGNINITLLIFVDGVGMDSRRDVLDLILTKADEFCQFRTLWKAAAIVAHKCGKQAAVALPKRQHVAFAAFCKRWEVNLLDLTALKGDAEKWIKAGDGLVHIQG